MNKYNSLKTLEKIINFQFIKTPYLYFGAGQFNDIERIILKFGKTVLILTGAHSFISSSKWGALTKSLKNKSIDYFHIKIGGEPSPDLIDNTVAEFQKKSINVVLSIGGGSVIDAGKAISAMLPQNNSVFNYLEGVGKGIKYNGLKVPFIAVPTTSGTGSEATKNASLSRVGQDGFKKSLRHDNLVPDIAVIDPELMLSTPQDITVSCGMDAFTQLLESYVSIESTPLTDALAWSGLEHLKDNLILACTSGAENTDVRAEMAYASLMSGITLANAKLGVVHGMASTIGGCFNIPHGVICGTLVGSATRINIELLKKENNKYALEKYAKVGALLSGNDSKDIDIYCELLVKKIDEWTETLKLPLLSKYGMKPSDLDKIADLSGNKNNPVQLDKNERKNILLRRI